MKKPYYLFILLLLCSTALLTGQTTSKVTDLKQHQFNLPDYKANKDALNDLEKIRGIVMRSKNTAFKARFMKQMNLQMQELLKVDANTSTMPVSRKFNSKRNPTTISGIDLSMNKNQMVRNSNSQLLTSALKQQKVPQAGVMKHRLDSIIFFEKEAAAWVPGGKQDFTYNYKAQVTYNGFHSYNNTTSSWDQDEISEITYDEAGRATMYLYKWWNDIENQWVIDEKMMMTYDNQGNLLVEESYSDQYDQELEQYFYGGNFKHEFAYDANNEEISSIYYEWDYDTDAWIPSSKNEFLYQDGMELMLAGYQWDSIKNMWIGHFKFEYQIVEGIDMLSSTFYHWNYDTDVWYISEKTVYEISSDVNGMVVTEIRSEVNNETQELILANKTVYSHPFAIGHNLNQSFRIIDNYYWENKTLEWIANGKTRNTFDTYGNIILRNDSVVRYNSVSDTYEWKIESAIEANVNASGKIIDLTVSSWGFDGINNNLNNKSRTLNTYNQQSALSEQVFQWWNFESGTWVNNNRMTFVYDDFGQEIIRTWYNSYNSETMEWIISRKAEQSFDSEGNQTVYATFDWDATQSTWKRTALYENVTNEAGEVIRQTNIQWNAQLNKEIIYYYMAKEYNSNGKLVLKELIETEVYWDGSQYSVMAYGEKVVLVYDELSRLITATDYDYNYTDNNFIPRQKYEYTFNANPAYQMALDYEIRYNWNATNSTWEKEGKGTLTNNFAVVQSEMILPFGDGKDSREVTMYFNYMPTVLYEYTWSLPLNDWVEEGRTNVYFSLNEFSEVEKVDAGVLSVYPNPVADYLTIRLPEFSQAGSFKLFDLQGRKLFEAPVAGELQVDLTAYSSGVYFYQMTTPSETLSGKLLKK
jgi:hypothetical protein